MKLFLLMNKFVDGILILFFNNYAICQQINNLNNYARSFFNYFF